MNYITIDIVKPCSEFRLVE